MSHTIPQCIPDDKPHYVYALSYPESTDGYVFYVGKGIGDRIHEHARKAMQAKPGKGANSYKENVMRKIWRNGEDFGKHYLAFFATHEEACMYEIALIFFMRPYGHLTNITDGGDGAWGYIHSEEARQKMSQALKGQKRSEETRQRVREAQRILRQNEEWVKSNREAALKAMQTEEWKQHQREAQKNSPLNQQHIQKLNAAKKGVPLSEERRRQMSEARKGRKLSEEHRQNVARAKTGTKRAPFSEEWLHNMSEAHRGQKRGSYSEEARTHMSEGQKKSLIGQAFREKHRTRRARGELTEKEREHLRQMSEANKGRKRGPMSEEQKQKISETKRKKHEKSQVHHTEE